MGFKNAAQRKAVWASRNEKKKGSPAKHCASDMMHSGGWQEMRKHNSPGTIGNKAGIKHNEKMRQAIGTFKMPHSPLNQGHKKLTADGPKIPENEAKAWADFKAGYMNRKEHMGKPITAEQNLAEYNREKTEFYYDRNKKKLRLIPTDDGEQKIMDGIEKNQLAPDRQSSRKIPGQDLDKVQVDERGEYAVNMYNRQDTIRPADGKNFKPFIKGKQSGKMPSGYLSDDDYTIKDGKISPLNKEGKKDACYHKVKSRVKVWPSAYASGQLVQCRKAGAANWGEKSKKK